MFTQTEILDQFPTPKSDCSQWAHQLIYDMDDKFEEVINADGEYETVEIYTNSEHKEREKKRWVRDVLKKHGRPVTINKLDYNPEPWNIKQDISMDDLDPQRDELCFDTGREVISEPVHSEVVIEQVTVHVQSKDIDTKPFTFDAVHIISPEATIQVSIKLPWETITNIQETLENMTQQQRVIEISKYQDSGVFVTWTIETLEPLFSRLKGLELDYNRSSAWFEFNNTTTH